MNNQIIIIIIKIKVIGETSLLLMVLSYFLSKSKRTLMKKGCFEKKK